MEVITALFALIPALNNAVFNSKLHLQTNGCATETIYALAYAKIIRLEFELLYVHPLTKNKSIHFFIVTRGHFHNLDYIKRIKKVHECNEPAQLAYQV